MSSSRELLAAALLFAMAPAHAQANYPGIGRAASAQELAAWDIDVRPDFKGLPKGAGSVAKGQQVWDAKCASCHGTFGESNEVFHPLVGGTGNDDIAAGRVARLTDPGYPGRTTLMKLATLSTLWDYINRAMPWSQPKSLSAEEVYAVTAYLLNLGGIVGDDFVLSDRNIADVQRRLPNRNGMSTEHALWPGKTRSRRPDVQAAACMNNCAPPPQVASSIPEHARDTHGNLAEQNRAVGAQRGTPTDKSSGEAPPGVERVARGAASRGDGAAAALTLAQKHACVACHALDERLAGPSFSEIADRYAGAADAPAYLAGKIKAGGAGVWGRMPMPAQALPEADAASIARWLAEGAKK